MTPPTVDRDARQDITDVLVRYATGIDRRDWGLFRTCFTDDCEADYGEVGQWRGVDAITEWMEQTHAPCGHTMHRITNHTFSPHGDDVAVRSYVDALVMGPDNRAGVRAAGFYDDVFARTDSGWKIAKRTFRMALAEPVTAGG